MNQQTPITTVDRNAADYAALVNVLRDYFDGLYFCDTKKLATVFHPQATYANATEGKLLKLGMDEYFPIVDKREPPASRRRRTLGRVRGRPASSATGARSSYNHAAASAGANTVYWPASITSATRSSSPSP